MIILRRSEERGHADHGWLQSFHSFSFADYQDPKHMGWGNLRVINEDVVAPGTGFGTHGHRDMEIVTYVLEGALSHKDDTGGGGVVVTGDVQRMSAGRGVRHSEFNHAPHHATHLLQIWIEPAERGIAPSYEQLHFDAARKRGRLCLVAGPAERAVAYGALTLNADASIYAGLFDGDEAVSLAIDPSRKAYVHLARGICRVNGHALKAGDAACFDAEPVVLIDQGQNAELMVFDLAT